MFNWIKRRRTSGKFSHRKTQRQDRPRQSTFRPRLEPLEERVLMYAGALDQSFGSHGTVLDSTFNAGEGGVIALQTDGKIVLAGTTLRTTQLVLERFNSDGGLDISFGTSGTVLLPGATLVTCIAIQSDGKIVVGGISGSGLLVRYNPDGTLDTTFNAGGSFPGIVYSDFTDIGPGYDLFNSITLQPDGKIVAAGDFLPSGGFPIGREFALARYNPDGTLDTTFGTQISIGGFTTRTGEVVSDFPLGSFDHSAAANAVAIQSNGRIVAAGYAGMPDGSLAMALARYNPDGTLDPDFQGSGMVVTSVPLSNLEARSIAIQPDGKIVTAGTISGSGTHRFLLARYNPDGSLDAGFTSAGLSMTQFPSSNDDEARSVALQADGKIVLAGQTTAFDGSVEIGLARYNSNGTLDKSFSFDGLVTTEPGLFSPSDTAAMVIQPDGKIIAAGISMSGPESFDFFLTRFLGDAGQLNFSSSTSSLPESGVVVPIIHNGMIIIPPGSGGNTAVLTVNRTGGATGTVTVDYATNDGTATAGVDYTATTGTLTFLDGETSKTISIPILDDGTLEGGTDTFFVTLSNPTGGATLGAVTKSVVTIKDDDIIGSSVNGTEGLSLTGVVATFAPSNPSVGAGDFVAAIDWGDGTIDAPDLSLGTITSIGSGRFNVTGTHAYAEEGSYPLVVHITGASSMDATNLFSATVNDAPLKATAINFAVTGHKSFSGVVANFTDVDPGGVASDYTATITWDDGTTSAGTITGTGPFIVAGSHVFGAFTGTHTITVTISDTGSPVSVTDIIKDPLAPSVMWGTWNPAINWTDVRTGDFDGDGRTDVIGRDPGTGKWWVSLSTGSGFTNSQWAVWNPALTWVDVQVGDFNGDGKADIAGRVSGNGQWWVSLSTGSSFTNSLWTTWNPGVHWVDVMVGDFTGDGKADLVGRAKETGQFWVAQSTGSSFTNNLWATWNTAAAWVDVNVGDFNGDGKADLVGRHLQGGGWWTAMSTGSSFTSSLWAIWNPAATWVDVKVGDFNGDGKADLTGRYLQGGNWWTAISTGSSFTTSLWTTWNTAITWVDVKVGDFTHDGKADIVGRVSGSDQWWVAQSDGSSFTNSLWATWNTGVTWADVQIGDFEGDGTSQIAGWALGIGQWWTGL
jgi:uncharacterized delta-60 repeat protein